MLAATQHEEVFFLCCLGFDVGKGVLDLALLDRGKDGRFRLLLFLLFEVLFVRQGVVLGFGFRFGLFLYGHFLFDHSIGIGGVGVRPGGIYGRGVCPTHAGFVRRRLTELVTVTAPVPCPAPTLFDFLSTAGPTATVVRAFAIAGRSTTPTPVLGVAIILVGTPAVTTTTRSKR